MSEIVQIDDKQYAVGLTWIDVANDKQADLEMRQLKGSAVVIRQFRKMQQAGIVINASLDGLFPGADLIANAIDANAAAISIIPVKRRNGDRTFWCVAVLDGRILSGGDCLLNTTKDVLSWISELSEFVVFNIYAGDDIAQALPDFIVLPVDELWRKAIKSNGIKITRRKISKQAALNLKPIVIALSIIGLSSGAYYYYQLQLESEALASVKTFTESDRQDIVMALQNEEANLVALDYRRPGISELITSFDSAMAYPFSIQGWHVTALTFDIENRRLIYQWQMKPKGLIEQLLAIRPNANVAYISNSEQSGKTATETKALRIPNHCITACQPEVSSLAGLEEQLVKAAQKVGFKYSVVASSPVQKRTPPVESGAVFTPRYTQSSINFVATSMSELTQTLSRLSSLDNVKATQLMINYDSGNITSWVLATTAITASL